MFKTALGRVRIIGISEGISYLALLGFAMPLKYVVGFPEAVMVCGWIHGVLFMLYLAAIGHVTLTDRWSWIRVTGAILAALIPFGPFILDQRLRKEHDPSVSESYQ